MLYEQWRNIAVARRNELALRDFASGRRWTFAELFADGERQPMGPAVRQAGARRGQAVPAPGGRPPVATVFPQGHSPQFILDLLAAWRENKLVCPLEAGQAPPEISGPPPHCVHLKTTSGTGGAARFVALTAEQLSADAENIVTTMGLRPECPNLGVISMAHSYGFSNLVLPLLLHGIPLTLVPAPLPEIIRRAAESEAEVTLAAVPPLWRAWHQAGAIPANVRLAISAGAPLSTALERAVFDAHGLKIHNFLGASECGGMAYDASETPRPDAALAGSAMRGVSLTLDEAGCLRVAGRAVAETYWPQPSNRLGKGQFQSSDLAALSDGLVFLRGRLSDEINVAGRKVSPESIERALREHPRVRECVVCGAPSRDSERTDTICAVVVGEVAEAELKQFLLQTLPAWQVPREWRFVEAIAASARGKISRAEWRRQFVKEGQR